MSMSNENSIVKNTTNVRNSGVELLRIFAIFGVIFIHFSEQAMPVLKSASIEGSFQLMLFIRSLFSSSVDVFLVISGYFLCKSYKRTVGKPFDLIWQVCIFQGGFYILLTLLGREPFGLSHIISAAIPDCYYTYLFVAVFLISPYLNKVLNSLTQKELKFFIIILLAVFSVYSTFCTLFCEITNKEWMGLSTITAWGSKQGFNIVNFILCYCIGAFIRLYEIPSKFTKNRMLFVLLALITLVIFIWAEINQRLPRFGMRSAWVYDNPLVILHAVVLFLIAKNINLKSKIVNFLAKAVYPTFIIHCLLIWYFDIEILCVKPWYVLLGGYLLFAMCSYVISIIVFYFYRGLFLPLVKKLDTIQIRYFEQPSDN